MNIQINEDNLIKYIYDSLDEEGQKDLRLTQEIQKKTQNNSNINNFVLMASQAIVQEALRLTPVKTGKLRNSLYVKKYGSGYKIGYSCEYATFVHEIGFYEHEPPTQYKFLEDAAEKIATQYLLDFNIELNIGIKYSPLEVYISNKKVPGEKLINIKNKERHNNNEQAFKNLYKHLTELDYESVKNNDYYSSLFSFIGYWGGFRNKDIDSILKEWLDRTRHNLDGVDTSKYIW